MAARALVSFEKKEKPTKEEELEKIIATEYKKILESFKIQDPLASNNFEDNVRNWPPVDLGKIFHYILNSKAFEADYVGQYKVKKAFSYFKSGFVGQVLSEKLSENKTVLKSKVLPSQKVTSSSHTVWALIEKNGDILTAYCSCTAGLSRCCNHVIALLYKIEYAVSEGYTNSTCTDIKCQFNDRSNKVIKGCKLKDIFSKNMKSTKYKKKTNTVF